MSVEEQGSSQVPHRSSFASLIEGRAGRSSSSSSSRLQTEAELQERAMLLLTHNHNLPQLLLESGSGHHHTSRQEISKGNSEQSPESKHAPEPNPVGQIAASLVERAVRRQAVELGVPVGVLCVRGLMERFTHPMVQGERQSPILNSAGRVQLRLILKAAQHLLAAGAFNPKHLWQEYWKTQPVLEVVCHLHTEELIPVDYILHSESGVSSWLVGELQSLCGFNLTDPEDVEVQQQILSTVVCVLVRSGFEEVQDPALSQTCCSVLDRMMSWLLDSLGDTHKSQTELPAGGWLRVFDTSLFGASISETALRRFFTHTVSHIFTHRPRLKVSDAITMQSQWSFTKTSPVLTALFCKVCVLFSVDEVLTHLQQVLETLEVNWQNVLSCLSSLLVYHAHTQTCLKDLLSRLLSSAFHSYDVERMITAFLLARQGALEGPAIFPSYSDWFKVAFGGPSGFHGSSKKSLVFLLKFLSDLVPFDPPQYLKVHIMHPPYITGKHRALLQEYISLAKTRLADLKVSVEEMGLFEVVSGAASEVQCPAQQDVEKAVALFQSTGRISSTVMEASIFRRPYFLSRFLPVLLTPRVLPDRPDTKMAFIEALRKAEKIPPALYSSYAESCVKEQQARRSGVCKSLEQEGCPQMGLQAQLQELRKLLSSGAGEGDIRTCLAFVSQTLSRVCIDSPDSPPLDTLIRLTLNSPTSSHTSASVVNVLLQAFCQCVLDACKVSTPNRQGEWAALFVRMLLGHTQLFQDLLLRLLQLLHIQGPSLAAAHVLGLAVLVVEMHMCRDQCPLVELHPSPPQSTPLSPSEALSMALPSSSASLMNFSLRFCVAAVCYGLCRSSSHSEELAHFIPCHLFKRLLFIVPRLRPEARTGVLSAIEGTEWSEEDERGDEDGGAAWGSVMEPGVCVKSSVRSLWRHKAIRNLHRRPQHQLSFCEWLMAELRVQRSLDALSDTERQVYEQWACQVWFLPLCVSEGGCGGSTAAACKHIINAVLDMGLQSSVFSAAPHTDSCRVDVLSRLRELVWEAEFSPNLTGKEDEEGHFIFNLITQRCSMTCDTENISTELQLQNTLYIFSSVMLSLSAAVLVRVRCIVGRRLLDCRDLMEHINHYQRRVCCPAGVLSFSLTQHFLCAVLSASVRCDSPVVAVNAALSELHMRCPLLLLSAGRWWRRVSPALCSLWGRVMGGEEQPALLQSLKDAHEWANRVVRRVSCEVPSAPAPLLAVCLYTMFEQQDGDTERIKSVLSHFTAQHTPVLVCVMFFYVTDLLSAHLRSQGDASLTRATEVSVHLLSLLVDSSDWLSLFHQSGCEQNAYQWISMVTTEQNARLMPFAFYSVLTGADMGVLNRALRLPGFLYTAVLSYSALMTLFLDGHSECVKSETPPQKLLARAQQIVLKSFSLSTARALTPSQRSQLEAACDELDPEVSAALSKLLYRADPSSPTSLW